MIKKTFITGLVAIIPVVLTMYVIHGLFIFTDGILGKTINNFLYELVGYEIPGLSIFIAILIVFLVGLVFRLSRMKLLKFIERMLFRIPLVNRIYFPIRQIVNFLFSQRKRTFKSAVLVEYPRKGIYSLGFVTNECFPKLKEKTGKQHYNVFMPSSPSPLTGFTIIVEEQELIFLDIGVDAAIKLVVSGGLLNPDEQETFYF